MLRSRRKQYTLIIHSYIGYGSYVIDFRRVLATEEKLRILRNKDNVHFVLPGWPRIEFPGGELWFEKDKEKLSA